ncbi:hypothetical protein LL036_06270 [Clostridium sp. CF011]|uniref:hypothetical protein n=1 Tax=Clostridium sp. CF011 TaxID=2843318 RepID=UPI00227B7D58|nr:hypothetical protein [Clostridium sp. CF011]WAG71027.1 hypothetical protein LL036_06270 [Clostridium sp. CF011]
MVKYTEDNKETLEVVAWIYDSNIICKKYSNQWMRQKPKVLAKHKAQNKNI